MNEHYINHRTELKDVHTVPADTATDTVPGRGTGTGTGTKSGIKSGIGPGSKKKDLPTSSGALKRYSEEQSKEGKIKVNQIAS